jgi:hypothetical protein
MQILKDAGFFHRKGDITPWEKAVLAVARLSPISMRSARSFQQSQSKKISS